eukprot:7765346-Alexandrium_andersonii.AAC.1
MSGVHGDTLLLPLAAPMTKSFFVVSGSQQQQQQQQIPRVRGARASGGTPKRVSQPFRYVSGTFLVRFRCASGAFLVRF